MVASFALATIWVFMVPIFQNPDEDAHFDYAVSIYANKGLISARDRAIEPDGRIRRSNPLTAYLEDATGFDNIRLTPLVKAPPGYGTAAFYSMIDQSAPGLAGQCFSPSLVGKDYPYGYYALEAGWLGLIHVVDKSSLALFFGARLLSALMLPFTLLLGHQTLRLLGWGRPRALIATAVVAFFPLTTFVAASVQPENLAWLLLSASVYLALRLRAHQDRGWEAGLLALAMAALAVTKAQYFLVGVVPVALLLANVWGLRPFLARLPLLALPALLAEAVQVWVVWHARNSSPAPEAAAHLSSYASLAAAIHAGPAALAAFLGWSIFKATFNFWFVGDPAGSFWGLFGWFDTPLHFLPRDRLAIGGASMLLAGLGGMRLVRVARRMLLMARHGRAAGVYRIAVANPLLNAYLLFTAAMFWIDVATDGSLLPQGRQWLPLLFGVVVAAVDVPPRFLSSPRARKLVSGAVLAALFGYSLVGSVVALAEVHTRYYGNGREPARASLGAPADSPPGSIGVAYFVPSGPGFDQPQSRLVAQGGTVAVGGWADGARAVAITVDGSIDFPAVYGDDLSNHPRSGFDAIFPTADLAVGVHTLLLKVVSVDGRYWEQPEGSFEVLPPPAPCPAAG